ncbi:CheR family methyltransferase [Mesorhizobium sp. KR1-2]|uniref:CheR family methyltransferase n=1 Tax=Mesorhizobium sp. KR1-2 TaxID=3156609 RepID=UPI0032B52122
MTARSARTEVVDDRLSERNFLLLADFIGDYSGIKMPLSKITMLEGRLRRRLRATGMNSFDDYCSYLFGEGMQSETIHFIDIVTTNKTDFFREPKHFDVLAETVLPDLAGQGHREIRAWSSACSTGAEPYTMAMILAESVEKQEIGNFTILATDLSTDVLEKAKRAVYDAEILRPVPTEMRRKYLMQPINPQRQALRVSPRLRSRVGFARLNLMDPAYRLGDPMHIIFCRNVLIYFDKPTQKMVLHRLCDCLMPGGYLFIGHSESITGLDLPVRQVANTVFKKL